MKIIPAEERVVVSRYSLILTPEEMQDLWVLAHVNLYEVDLNAARNAAGVTKTHAIYSLLKKVREMTASEVGL